VLFGFYPMPLLNVINPFVQDTLQQVGVTDPGPTVPVAQNAGGQQ
jgi:NADH-quinone oxidoreductase subunit M